ncbi:MAG: hypothetical protein RBG13Loki_3243 [Promethearchaeota archaeon CR_4]|nr:MAG: hypothetical protein RBG13Loki_3243 [Candidatus Lokiarchaeota archaeon CR_4]
MTVTLDEENVQQMAYLVSQEQRSWDEYTWMLAQEELRLGAACAMPKEDFRHGGLPKMVKIFPAKIQPSLNEEEVRKLAFEIAQRSPSLQDLHWFIAQRRCISDFILKQA